MMSASSTCRAIGSHTPAALESMVAFVASGSSSKKRALHGSCSPPMRLSQSFRCLARTSGLASTPDIDPSMPQAKLAARGYAAPR